MAKTSKELGNPIAVATTASTIISNPTVQKAGKIVGVVAAGGLSIYFGRKFYLVQRAKNTLRKGTKEVQQAVQLRSAMMRWGGTTFPHQSSFLSSFVPSFTIPDGTDEKLIGQIASQITNWPQVQKDYYSIFWTELISDLQSELSTKEFDGFFSILNRVETTKEELKETAKGHYSVGEKIFANKLIVKAYDEKTLDSVIESYDIGEEIGTIVSVYKNPKGEIIYRLREWIYPDSGWIPGLFYIWVRGVDVTNNKKSNSLTGLTIG